MHGSGIPNGSRDQLVPASVLKVAAASPDATALVHLGEVLSYRELASASRMLAGSLGRSGIAHGSVVGLLLPRGADRISVTLASWRLGAVPFFLDPIWPDQRVAELLADAGCSLLVADDAVRSRALPGVDVLVPPASTGLPGDQPAEIDARIVPDDIAYLIATSGSSGRPKLVEITHGNLAALVRWHNTAFDVAPEDRATHLAGLGFDAAVWEVWPYLAAGAVVQIAPDAVRSDGERLRDWLVESRATIAFAPTLLAEQLLGLPWPECSLRTLLTGGDRLRAVPPRGLPFTLVNNYGPTECTVVACSGVVAPGAALPPSVGMPIAGSYVRILDGELRPVEPGEVGELWIGGAGVGRGYRGQRDATAAAFRRDHLSPDPAARIYRTGDLGSWREDGSIAFHGRADDQLKIRGHRVEPDEVATVLARHPQVAAATVKGLDGPRGITLVAYVQPAPGPLPGSEDVHAFLAERLPDWSVPSAYVRVEALPTTSSGKLDRQALPPPCDGNRLPTRAYAAPADPTEERLLEIMGQIMGGGTISVDDNFFLLGGHSLLGTQVVLRAGEQFGVELTLRDLFQAPTVRALARVIEARVEELVASMSEEEVLLRAHG